MAEYIVPSVLVVFAAMFALLCALTLVGGLQMTRKVRNGALQYCFVVLFFGNALALLATTKGPDAVIELIAVAPTNALAVWAIRLTSVFVLLACADQFVRYLARNPKIEFPRIALILTLITTWAANIFVPAFFAEHPVPFQLNWIYTPLLCMGLICLTRDAADSATNLCRNALVVFCALSLLLIPIRPDLVLQSTYAQGYLPGVPRLSGLAPHAIVMGMNASVGLWCLLANPFKSRRLNQIGLLACVVALFLAQSKTVWMTAILALPVIWYFRKQRTGFRAKSLKDLKAIYVLGAAVMISAMIFIFVWAIFGGASDRLSDFSSTKEGAQIFTLTGRDKIWEAALNEWRNAPWLGYGLPLFSPDFRIQMHFSGATSGHNQFIDALGRCGIIGCTAFALYYIAFTWLGFRYARASHGLSAALALSLVFRSISEVPINLSNLGIDATPHYLLLAIIAGNVWKERRRGV